MEEVIFNKDITSNIYRVFKVNLNLKDNENCLILSDVPNDIEFIQKTKNEISSMINRTLLAREFYKVCYSSFSKQVDFKTFRSTGMNGAEPPAEISTLMLNYNVIVILTTYSLSHTKARENASLNGARIASMPGFNVEMLRKNGPMDVDYNEISEVTKKIAARGLNVKKVTVETSSFKFTFNKDNREFLVDDGLYTTPGSWGNLPAGEAFCAPVEGSSEGNLIIRKGWFPDLDEDLELIIRKGFVTMINGGGQVGENLKKLLGFDSSYAIGKFKSRRNIAEFGIGSNPKASRLDNILESEKIKGTVHIAIGDNINFGGKTSSDIHLDFIFPDVNVYFDNILVIEKGRWLF
ncbi:MAG: aminopeptidase [Candidatus Odinarchaeia archaeon]